VDIEACLKRIRELCQLSNRDTGKSETLAVLEELAQHVEALDQWLSKKGFLPKDWER
jgi:hypothetical protein